MKLPRSIPEIPLRLEPATPEAQAAVGFKWAADNIGKRHKRGGSPGWLQDADVTGCPDRKASMTFYGQLDSIGDGASALPTLA